MFADRAGEGQAPDAKPPIHRRRWQFRLRTLFVFVAMFALALSWPTRLAYRQRQAVAFVESVGGTVEYRTAEGAVAGYVRKWVGRDYVDGVVSIYLAGAPISDDDVRKIAPLSSVQTLSLVQTRLTSASVHELSCFRELTFLDVRFTQFDEQGFAALKRALPRAKVLCWNDAE